MNISEFIAQKKELYAVILNFIENKNNSDDSSQETTNFLDTHQIRDNKEDMRLLLHLIVKITNNHHRDSNFLSKIKKLLQSLEQDIKQTFSNLEIFDLFKKSKILLLYLFEMKIVTVDETIAAFMLKKSDSSLSKFFYNEIKPFTDDRNSKAIEKELSASNAFKNFEENRQKGENESILCELIRRDSIDEFTSHVSENKLSLSSKIKLSLFETNPFLIKKKEPTLIEYSAFYGSIQIFKYLQQNKIELKPSLWLYAIHSNNIDLIRLLDENKIEPDDKTFNECLKESIKCHHREMTKIINDHLSSQKDNDGYKSNLLYYCFHYYNFPQFPSDFISDKFTFYYACNFDYIQIVKFYLKNEKVEINAKIILKVFPIKFLN
ncbi:hypothetical protein M9Y10_006688 [Tritrichomonas musculus]|uniref:DUF3447 domain-containing protein n=1 Tax=Tritrichomonas musculus TaxID=1915356 RepID=A0ABR2JF21_9EUKA